MKQALLSNLNALVMVAGFACLEMGIAAQWSASVAAIVAGVLLMVVGAWPYVVITVAKARKG